MAQDKSGLRAREEIFMKNRVIEISNKRHSFHVVREEHQIEQLLDGDLPNDGVYKMISEGGFSSIGIIRYVATRTHIKELIASTLRVGKKHIECLNVLHAQRRLDRATFIIGSVMKNDSEMGKSYGYYDLLTDIASQNGWKVICKNNHSKVLLMDTIEGKFVVETSSNLNENPNMEQFSFEKSEMLFDYYKMAFIGEESAYEDNQKNG